MALWHLTGNLAQPAEYHTKLTPNTRIALVDGNKHKCTFSFVDFLQIRFWICIRFQWKASCCDITWSPRKMLTKVKKDKKILHLEANMDVINPSQILTIQRVLLWFRGKILTMNHSIFLLKGSSFFFLLFVSLLSSRQEDRYHSFDRACSNKEETGWACPPLISLAQILALNGKC